MFWNGKDELDKRLARLTKINAWRWLFCLNTTFVLPKLDGWCVVCHYGTIYNVCKRMRRASWPGGRDEAEEGREICWGGEDFCSFVCSSAHFIVNLPC